MYIDKLDEIVNRYNNIYPTIKRKAFDVNLNTYVSSGKETDDEDPKFKVGNHVRTSKYKSIFAKTYIPNWSEEVFIIKKLKNTVVDICY